MTCASGYAVVLCPHCGTAYRRTHYSSINLTDSKRWSDGSWETQLYKPSGPLKWCASGHVFLSRRAPILIDRVWKPEPQPQRYRPSTIPGWRGALRRFLRIQELVEQPLEGPAPAPVPYADAPFEADVDRLRAGELYRSGVWGQSAAEEAALLELHWQGLNLPYAESVLAVARQGIAQDQTYPAVPLYGAFLPTQEQTQVMHRMLALGGEEGKLLASTTRMEVQRQLGRYEEAEETYRQTLAADVADVADGRWLLAAGTDMVSGATAGGSAGVDKL